MNEFFIINTILLVFLVVIAVAAVLVRNLLVSTIMLSVFSFLMAVIYLVLGAPDVAITEAAVGAGFTTILFLSALIFTGEQEKKYGNKFGIIAVVIVLGALFYSVVDMPAVGDKQAPANLHIAKYYMDNTEKDIGIPAVVTAVLASYRGYDTLGETVVIYTAGISILLILGAGLYSTKNRKD